MEEERIHYWVNNSITARAYILTLLRVSLFYLVGLFDLWDGLRTLFISAAATYIIAAKVRSPYMPWMGFVFLMGHMSINHIQRQRLGDDSIVDITGTLPPTYYLKTVANQSKVLKW
jgi:hypothetical protein